MKKIVATLSLAIFLVSTSYAGKQQCLVELAEVSQVLQNTDLTKDSMEKLFAGDLPDIALEYKKGGDIPFKFAAKLDNFSLKLDPNLSVKVIKNCYCRFIKEKTEEDEIVNVYRSYDLENWKLLGPLNMENFSLSADGSKAVVELNF